MLRYFSSILIGLVGLLMAQCATASISLSSTRVIFEGAHKEANVTVRNGGQTVLVQSWLDSENSTAAPPFAVTPPLARLEANQQQLLRILYEGRGMPVDKESVVWLNVQEIPQSGAVGANTLQLAVRQRIKVFFRPAGLAGEASKAPEQLTWALQQTASQAALKVTNTSLYHVSLADLKVGSAKNLELVMDSTMIAPGAVKSFPLKNRPQGPSTHVQFSAINDYGAQQFYSGPLSDLDSHAERSNDPAEK